MYCSNCGKRNPEDSKFCQYCGAKFTGRHIFKEANKPAEHASNSEYIDQKTPPYPYVISPWKLFILGAVTFGLFTIYWFYRQFKSFYAVKNLKHGWFHNVFVSIFCPITSFTLFPMIAKEMKEVDPSRGFAAGWLATIFFVSNFLFRLPNPYWLLGCLGTLALIKVQKSVNYYWEKKCGDKVVKSRFGIWNFITAFMGIILLVLALYGGTTNMTDFKTSYRNSFVQSCEKTAGSSASYCGCVADYMINNYTEVQLTQFSLQYTATGQLPQELNNAADLCISDKNTNGSSQ